MAKQRKINYLGKPFKSGMFKYVDTIRDKKGKLRCWRSHDKLTKEQRGIDWGIQDEKRN